MFVCEFIYFLRSMMSFSLTSLPPRSDRSNLRTLHCADDSNLAFVFPHAKRLHEVVEAEFSVELISMQIRLEDIFGKVHET